MTDTGLTLMMVGVPLCLIPMFVGSAFPPRSRRVRIAIAVLVSAGFLLAIIGLLLGMADFFYGI